MYIIIYNVYNFNKNQKKMEYKDDLDKDLINKFKNDKEFAKMYLDSEIEEYNKTGNIYFVLDALKLMATAYGWTRLERETGLKRATLYNTLNNKSEPKISTFQKILNALGFVSEIKLSNNQYKTI